MSTATSWNQQGSMGQRSLVCGNGLQQLEKTTKLYTEILFYPFDRVSILAANTAPTD